MKSFIYNMAQIYGFGIGTNVGRDLKLTITSNARKSETSENHNIIITFMTCIATPALKVSAFLSKSKADHQALVELKQDQACNQSYNRFLYLIIKYITLLTTSASILPPGDKHMLTAL